MPSDEKRDRRRGGFWTYDGEQFGKAQEEEGTGEGDGRTDRIEAANVPDEPGTFEFEPLPPLKRSLLSKLKQIWRTLATLNSLTKPLRSLPWTTLNTTEWEDMAQPQQTRTL